MRDYLIGKGTEPRRARAAAAEIGDLPLTITKRGALVFGRSVSR